MGLDREIEAGVAVPPGGLDALPQHDPEVALPEGTQRVIVQLQVMPTAPRGAA